MDPSHANPRAVPGVLQSLVLLVGAFGLMLAFGCGMGLVQMALTSVTGVTVPPGTVHPALSAAGNLLALGLAVAAGTWLARAPAREVLPLQGFSGWLVVPMAATVVGASAVMSEGDNLLRSVLPMPELVAELFQQAFTGEQSVWGSLLLVVIVAPLTEEMLFRGVILRGFLLRYTPVAAIAGSAVLFALFHANPWQLAAPLTLGCIFGWWMLHTRSLWPCLLGHALNNGIPMSCKVVGLEIRGYTTAFDADLTFQPWWFDLAGAALLVLGIAATAVLFRRRSRAGEWAAAESGDDGSVPGLTGTEDRQRAPFEGGGLPAAGGGDPGVGGGAAVEDQ